MNNVQRCLCHFYTWMRHSKQTATLLLTKRYDNFDTSTSAKGYARVCTNCACAIVVLGILLAQARPTMPCIHLVILALLTTYHTFAAGRWAEIDSTAESASFMSTRDNHVVGVMSRCESNESRMVSQNLVMYRLAHEKKITGLPQI